jgi:hypothetical protein
MKTTQNTIARRNAHLAALASLHAVAAKAEGMKMFRQLRRLEAELHRAATAQCNGAAFEGQPFRPDWNPDGSEGTEENPTEWEIYAGTVRERVGKIFGGVVPAGFVFNQDPRGYALKLKTAPGGMESDWGGFGILAAEINN